MKTQYVFTILNLFLLQLVFGAQDDIYPIQDFLSHDTRSRGQALMHGRGLSVYIRANPQENVAISYRYIKDGVEHWTLTADLLPPGTFELDQFGGGFNEATTLNYYYNMDLIHTPDNGEVFLVGAAYADGSESNTGKAYVYSGKWTQWSLQQTLSLETQNENDFFGTSVALNKADPTTAAITCLGCDPFHANSSATYIYRSEPPLHNRWSQQQVLIPYNPNVLYLGYGLVMHKNTLVVSGTSRNDPLLFDLTSDGWYGTGIQDRVYVYHRPPGSNYWTEQQQLEGASVSYSIAFMVQVEDDTIGISNGRLGGYLDGELKIYYPDTPEYQEKPKAKSWSHGHSADTNVNSNFILNDAVKPRPRSPQWSLQQILVDPTGNYDGGFGSYFTFHGNSMAVSRPLFPDDTSEIGRAIFIYERPFLGGQWSVQQTFTGYPIAESFFPMTWYGSTIVIGDTSDQVRVFSSATDWSCLVISMEDTFGDGWGEAKIRATAPDGTFDEYRPYCDTPNPISFRYCPLDGSDRGLYTFVLEDALKSKFHWEIQWQIFEEKTGLWYRGNHKTRMDFYWEPTTRDFTRRGIVGDVPLNISCINNCKSKPTPKPTPSKNDLPFRALKELKSSSTHPPTNTPAPTLAQTENTVWQYLTMTGSGWFNEKHRGTNYYISDIEGKRLISTGTKCDEFTSQNCWQALPDGDYILRVSGYLNEDGGTRGWSFCGRQGVSEDMLVFSVENGECDALEYYTRSTYCLNKLHTVSVADVTFMLYGVSQPLTGEEQKELSTSLSFLFTEIPAENIKILSSVPSGSNLIVEIAFHVPVAAYGYDAEEMSSIKQTYETFMTQLQSFTASAQLRLAMSSSTSASELTKLTSVEIIDDRISLHEYLPESSTTASILTMQSAEPVPYSEPTPSPYTMDHLKYVTEKVLAYSGAIAGYVCFMAVILISLIYVQAKARKWYVAHKEEYVLLPQEIVETTGKNTMTVGKRVIQSAHSFERNLVSFLDDIGDAVVDFVSPPVDEFPSNSRQF